MLNRLSFKHRLLGFAIVVLAAGCALPLQPALVDPAAPQANVDTGQSLAEATAPPATLAPTGAAPATLENSVVASLWDEETGTSAVLPIDPFTGEALPAYPPIVLGEGFTSARSPNGQVLAAISYGDRACDGWAGGSRCQPSDGVLRFIELAAWRDTPTSVHVADSASFLAFSPDSRLLAIGQSRWPEHSLLLVDVINGALLAETALDFYPRQAAFTAGSGLMVYGADYEHSHGFNPEARAALFDPVSLSLVWQTALPGVLDGQYVDPESKNVHDESVWWQPAVVFAPDTQRLYVVHADEDLLTTVDFAAQTVSALEVGPAQSWLDRLMALTAGVAEAKVLNGTDKHAVLSADGRHLYVVGAQVDTRGGQYTRTPLGLQVIDAATGVVVETLDTPAGSVALAPGGTHLLLTHWDTGTRTDIVPVDDLSALNSLAGVELQPGRLAGGLPALFALRTAPESLGVAILDPQTFTELAHWSASSALWLLP